MALHAAEAEFTRRNTCTKEGQFRRIVGASSTATETVRTCAKKGIVFSSEKS